jgi:hypothetical protein
VGVCSLVGPDEGLVLLDATPVRLRLSRNLSSADTTVGEAADFEVLDEVKIGDALVIGRGDSAIATVTNAEPKKRMARGNKKTSGRGHTGGVRGHIVATPAIVFFPAARFSRFMRGKDITIPKVTEITAFMNSEIKLDPTKFVPAEATASRSRLQAGGPAGPKLTKADIFKRKELARATELIVARLKHRGAYCNLGVDDLLELKKANVL